MNKVSTQVVGRVKNTKLMFVLAKVLCTRYFILQKYRTQFIYDEAPIVHQLSRLMCQNM